MKILVLSDSHGFLNYMCQAIQAEKPDYLIHLGDHSSDAEELKELYPTLSLLSVRGNCDPFDFHIPEFSITVCDNFRIMAVHGHRYGVKSGLLRLVMAAKEKAVHIALFGHTHCAYCENYDGIWLLNPGSCGIRSHGTYGVIEIVNSSVNCVVKTLAQEETR